MMRDGWLANVATFSAFEKWPTPGASVLLLCCEIRLKYCCGLALCHEKVIAVFLFTAVSFKNGLPVIKVINEP